MYDPFAIAFVAAVAILLIAVEIARRVRRARRWRTNVIERLDALTIMGRVLIQSSHHMEDDTMATKDTLARLTADVQANTDATLAAAQALAGFVATVADLTAQLQAAIEGGDEAEIKAAADAIEANNSTLTAAVPVVAKAVVAGTPAAPPAE